MDVRTAWLPCAHLLMVAISRRHEHYSAGARETFEFSNMITVGGGTELVLDTSKNQSAPNDIRQDGTIHIAVNNSHTSSMERDADVSVLDVSLPIGEAQFDNTSLER